MDHVIIRELEVFYRVGVPEAERARPQRLLLSLDLEVELAQAAVSDNLEHTIDYHAVTCELLAFGQGRSWRLIEKLAADVADLMLTRFRARSATVEVRKFIIPEARYVAVRLVRSREGR